MSENTSALLLIQDALSLQDVFVRRAAAHVEDDFDPKHSQVSLGIQLKYKPNSEASVIEVRISEQSEDKAKLLRYIVDTGVRFVEANEDIKNPEVNVRAEIIATFVADYLIKDSSQIDQDKLALFTDNVVYHVWPYWREFVQSTCNRLRLPPVVLPPFKIKRKVRSEQPVSSPT